MQHWAHMHSTHGQSVALPEAEPDHDFNHKINCTVCAQLWFLLLESECHHPCLCLKHNVIHSC